MKTSKGLDWYNTAKERDGYWFEKAKNRFAATINRLMTHRKTKQKDLAAELKVSPANISKMLRGDANLRIETMVKLARALDAELSFQLTPNEAQTPPWVLFPNGGSQSVCANDEDIAQWKQAANKGEPSAAVS